VRSSEAGVPGLVPSTTPASTQCTTSSSCGSGVNDDGQCDDGGFKLDTASVVAEAAVERKEVRRVRPLLSELQVPEWQELAVDRRKWRKVLKSTDIVWCYRQNKSDCLRRDTTLTNRGPRQAEGQGNSGDGLHHKQAQVDLGW
jgi:hypothetical protein